MYVQLAFIHIGPIVFSREHILLLLQLSLYLPREILIFLGSWGTFIYSMACINRTLQTLGREIGLTRSLIANHWQLGHFYSMSTMSFVLACFNLFVYLQSLTNATDLQVTLGEIGLNNLEVDANRQRICQCEYRVSENVMGKRVLRVSCHSWGCLISITKNNKSKCRYVPSQMRKRNRTMPTIVAVK